MKNILLLVFILCFSNVFSQIKITQYPQTTDLKGALPPYYPDSALMDVSVFNIHNNYTTKKITMADVAAYINDKIIDTNTWLPPVISFDTNFVCTSGDSLARYIASATSGGWTKNYIYECTGISGVWTQTIPVSGYAVVVSDSSKVFLFNGTSWVALSANGSYWSINGNNIFNNNGGSVYINTVPPSYGPLQQQLYVNGNAKITGQTTLKDTLIIGNNLDSNVVYGNVGAFNIRHNYPSAINNSQLILADKYAGISLGRTIVFDVTKSPNLFRFAGADVTINKSLILTDTLFFNDRNDSNIVYVDANSLKLKHGNEYSPNRSYIALVDSGFQIACNGKGGKNMIFDGEGKNGNLSLVGADHLYLGDSPTDTLLVSGPAYLSESLRVTGKVSINGIYAYSNLVIKNSSNGTSLTEWQKDSGRVFNFRANNAIGKSYAGVTNKSSFNMLFTKTAKPTLSLLGADASNIISNDTSYNWHIGGGTNWLTYNYSLNVASSNTTTGLFVYTGGTSSSNCGIVTIASDNNATITSGHRFATLRFAGSRGTGGNLYTGAQFVIFATENWATNKYGADLAIYTVPTGTATGTEKLRISNDGNIVATFGFNKGADIGSTDTYAATITGISAYSIGTVYYLYCNTKNTGACSYNINGLGAIPLKMRRDQDPEDDYIEAGSWISAIYDGTNLQIQTPDANP